MNNNENLTSNEISKENIFIIKNNDKPNNYDSALILNYNNKKILKIYQVIDGESKIKKLYDNFQILENELKKDIITYLENLLNINFDYVEYKLVLNYYTYETIADNVMHFYEKNKINYILFDYKHFLLFDKNKKKIWELEIDKKSIIFENNNKNNTTFNNMYKKEINYEESNFKEDIIITNNTNLT